MNTDAPAEVEQGDELLVPAGGEASPLVVKQEGKGLTTETQRAQSKE